MMRQIIKGWREDRALVYRQLFLKNWKIIKNNLSNLRIPQENNKNKPNRLD